MIKPLALLVVACALLHAGNDLAVLPGTVDLNGPEARQHLLAEASLPDHQEDWTRKAGWRSSDPKVATVDANGEVRPISDGEATITATANGRTATATVHVKNSQAAHTWSFRNDVIPVMTKVGCNQGACHGALAGKNGFKLTLRGYDPDVDYDTLTRQSVGRRIDPEEPARSLMLLKPTMAVPHGGGKRFDSNSLEYKILSGWIAEGTPRPRDDDPQVTALEVFPAAARLDRWGRTTARRARQILRWPCARRYALGEVQLERRRRGFSRRLGPREDERQRGGRDHAVVFQPRALRARQRSVSEQGRGRGL